MSKLRKTLVALGLAGLLSLTSPSFADDVSVLTSEVAYRGPLTVKVKPTLNISKGKTKRQLEFLLGKGFKIDNLKLGAYFDVKSDLEGTQCQWIGARGELDHLINNTHFGVELRHFSGLNEDSDDHFYFVPYVMQDLTDNFGVGIWDYIKQNYDNNKGFSYLGPFIVISPSKNLDFLLHLGEDIKNNGKLYYMKMNFDIKK